MRWTLEDVRTLEIHECNELVAWLHDEAKRAADDGDGTTDMDELLDAKLAAETPPEGD
jgi:hypothetical protein